MTALRCVSLVGVAAVLVTVGATVCAGALATGCTSGTTPVCDDAGSCLILVNPTDGTVNTVTDAAPLEDTGPAPDASPE
jgi:hypothetical protein